MAEECVKMYYLNGVRPRFLPANRTVSHGSAPRAEREMFPGPAAAAAAALHSFDLVPARQIQLFLARRPVHAPAEHFLDSSKIVGLQTTVKIVALPARYGVAGAFWSPRKNAGQAGSFKSNRHTLQGRRVREEVGSIASIAIDLPLIAKLALRPHQFAVCYVERNTQ